MIKIFIFLGAIGFGFGAMAHAGHHHDMHSATQPVPQNADALPAKSVSVTGLIAERYRTEVQPIFQRACYDCHSSKTLFPWYHEIPGVRQWIDSDIDEAKQHINMDPGFPFESHATPEEDLKAIGEEVQSDEMPPWTYRAMHSASKLSPDEKAKVQAWVKFGLDQLKAPPAQ